MHTSDKYWLSSTRRLRGISVSAVLLGATVLSTYATCLLVIAISAPEGSLGFAPPVSMAPRECSGITKKAYGTVVLVGQSHYGNEFTGRYVAIAAPAALPSSCARCKGVVGGRPNLDEFAPVETRANHRVTMPLKRRVAVKSHPSTLTKAGDYANYSKQRKCCQGIVYCSERMEAVVQMIERVAPWEVPVLIPGESGTGKELVARAVHALSGRGSGSLVPLNCGEIVDTLAGAELFGHERSAFSGADRARDGLFAAADGGSIFLDEVSECSPKMQVSLLRSLQEQEIRRVGSNETQRVDVRVIAVTNKDLRAEIKAGRFREDLFYRLNVWPVAVPPLRERREDIPPLVMHFIKCARPMGRVVPDIHPESLSLLMEYDWPGNVRELENFVQRVLIIAGSEANITRGHVVEAFNMDRIGQVSIGASVLGKGVSPEIMKTVLERNAGVKEHAANELGLSHGTFYRRLEKLGLHVPVRKVSMDSADMSTDTSRIS